MALPYFFHQFQMKPMEILMDETFHPLTPGSVRLLPSLFQRRYDLNRKYMLSLKTEHLLQNFYMEAGLWGPAHHPEEAHWGWESPTCQLRGHFLGHWLSGAAWMAANNNDAEMRGKAETIVSELARCQKENGGEWVGSIPAQYLDWIARGKQVWAPHYTLHKTLMGLYDMYAVAGSQQALDVLVKWARWFHRWSGQFTTAQMDDILDHETGGMLEVWANLYGVTGEKEHYELIGRYDRRRLFDPLIEGKDVLTNMHMNTTIPEVHGAARAWEVTGEERWRKIVDEYWRLGVTERGMYATGAQTNGEIWSPPGELAARLGNKTQEHCTVYNMMRLAEYLYRWTGEPTYADYWERNLWNGILAQQNPETGMIAYFLPLNAGAVKIWGTPTEDFWCCHGSLVQAHPIYANNIFYADADGLVVSQAIPAEASWGWDGGSVQARLEYDPQLQEAHRPRSAAYRLKIESSQPETFTLKLRMPWWMSDKPRITVNGEEQSLDCAPSSYAEIRREWSQDTVEVLLPKKLRAVSLPDEPGTFAFMDGPVVLAGLNPGGDALARTLYPVEKTFRRPKNYIIDGPTLTGDPAHPERILAEDNEREWVFWQGSYRTVSQPRNMRFIPLYDVKDEVYTVYFPVEKQG